MLCGRKLSLESTENGRKNPTFIFFCWLLVHNAYVPYVNDGPPYVVETTKSDNTP